MISYWSNLPIWAIEITIFPLFSLTCIHDISVLDAGDDENAAFMPLQSVEIIVPHTDHGQIGKLNPY